MTIAVGSSISYENRVRLPRWGRVAVSIWVTVRSILDGPSKRMPGQPSGAQRDGVRGNGGLTDAIILTPDLGVLRIELEGNLAAMLGEAQNAKRSPETGDLSLQVVMVAGAGFEPATFGL